MKKYLALGLLAIAFAVSNILTPTTSLAEDRAKSNTEYFQNDCCYNYNNNR